MAWGWVASVAATVVLSRVASWLVAKLGGDGGDSAREAGVVEIPDRWGVPSQTVYGRARVAGIRAFAAETRFEDADIDIPAENGGGTAPKNQRSAYFAIVLSEGEIDTVEAIWVGGRPMPFVSAGNVFSSHATSGRTLDTELLLLRDRRTALLAGGGTPTDPGLLALLQPIDARIADIEDSLAWDGWTDNDGNPTVLITVDTGTSGTSRADTEAARASYISSQVNTGDAFPLPGNLRRGAWSFPSTMRFDGLAWAWVELVSPKEDGQWQGLPDIEFLVRGKKINGTWTDNPATIAADILVTRFGQSRDDIVGLTTAEARCAERVTFPLVVLGDSNSDKPVTSRDVLDSVYGPGNRPSRSIRNRVIADWNTRYAGAGNARRRYEANGVVRGDTEPERVLEGLAGAMAGDIIDLGGKWRVQAGGVVAAQVTISEADIVNQSVEWILEGDEYQRGNAATARLVSDEESDWDGWDMPEVVDQSQVDADGKALLQLGNLPWTTSRLHARRLVGLALRQAQPGLRVAEIEAGFDTAKITPGDRITIDDVSGWSGTVFVESVELNLDTQTTRLVVREELASLWTDGWSLPGVDVVQRRVTSTPVPPATGVGPSRVEWQNMQRRVVTVVTSPIKSLVLFVSGVHITPQDEDRALVWRRSSVEPDDDGNITIEDWKLAPASKTATATDPVSITSVTTNGVRFSRFDHSIELRGGGGGLYLQLAVRETDADGNHTYYGQRVVNFTAEEPALKDKMVRVTAVPTTGGMYPEGTLLCLPVSEDT